MGREGKKSNYVKTPVIMPSRKKKFEINKRLSVDVFKFIIHRGMHEVLYMGKKLKEKSHN